MHFSFKFIFFFFLLKYYKCLFAKLIILMYSPSPTRDTMQPNTWYFQICEVFVKYHRKIIKYLLANLQVFCMWWTIREIFCPQICVLRIRPWYARFVVLNCFEISLFTVYTITVNIDSEKSKNRASSLHNV